jgi:hypothetical protein
LVDPNGLRGSQYTEERINRSGNAYGGKCEQLEKSRVVEDKIS